ncbi:tRNA (adenosine(37)-N6)-threonylcarbamoyltransferase complex dimerization subunit type 1 TsaB [Salinimonas marina]|uniref:tRNA threonylcarbamoyladenosine biosynthesis protein TsaB n=1 Tax=Salinimonas marina TaxID=2785918 RepID=A0A7S9DZQ6_9ALTE|nr:tRNA (adenosine(37)-N6)-threonylcarbamoyltransferase complex dimerization subunit type 1 TsaB [Salinimonas marina]QPG06648.1 tRNA (adenosine(37)-N6)-threonylcarbamoyltransferase complex dimerization subunit type 1 TsaB [Salinimonas marina]
MKNLLAIDTATEALSVALQFNQQTFHRFEICPQQHSQKLLPMIDEVLNEAGAALQDLDGLVFGRGPGSFTGVRIATGMIQGLALGSQLPVVGVSTLAAMAQQAVAEQQASHIVTAIDARMNEVYFGCFKAVEQLAVSTLDEQVCAPELAAQLLPVPIGGQHFVAVGTGWQAYPALTEQCSAQAVSILYPHARYMLALAEPEFEAGRTYSAETAEPVYLRDKVTWKKLPGRE